MTELTELSQLAARSAAAAAMSACAASNGAAAALRRGIKIEPLLEAFHEQKRVEKRDPEPVDNLTPHWGYTKSRGSKIIKPLGFLESNDPTSKKSRPNEPQEKAKTAYRRLRDNDFPNVLKKGSVLDENAFDATSYAAKKAARIEAARVRRGSIVAVALPAIQKKRSTAKKKGSKGSGGKIGGGFDSNAAPRSSLGSSMTSFSSGDIVEEDEW
jgi:hypothetical protein